MSTIEYTDTFGGEANYAWVKRWSTRRELSERGLVRMAKAAAGLAGVRCRKENWGDVIALYPVGCCTVLFIGWQDDDCGEFGVSLDK